MPLLILWRESLLKGGLYNLKWIWKAPTIPKILLFIWLACDNSIAVNDNFSYRGMNVEAVCVRCNNQRENIIHFEIVIRLLRFGIAFSIWEELIMNCSSHLTCLLS